MRKALTLIGLLFAGGWAMGQLRITEICPRPGVVDANGKESGWIELTNTSETETVNLSDYALIRFNRGKKDSSKNRLKLLSQEVGPGERFVVYASESYANFADIGGSGKVEWLGETEPLMVYPVKINPKKWPTVRLYKGSSVIDTFEVPVDLADGKSFAPGSGKVSQALVASNTPYSYRLVGEEAWQTGGTGALAVAADREITAVEGALDVTISADSPAFTETQVVAGGVTRTAWDLSSNTGKNTGLTAPADTLKDATEAYTVAFWFKAQSIEGHDEEGNSRVLFDYRPKSVTDKSGVIVVLTSEGQLRVQGRDANRRMSFDYSTDSEADYGDGTWHHVVLVVGRNAGSAVKFWADGVREISASQGFAMAARTDVPICFGQAYDSTSWAVFNGAMSDIRLYPRALSDAEAEVLFGEDAAAREITGTLTKADAITEADGIYTFSGTLENAASAQLYSSAAVATLASAGETVDLWLKPSTLVPSKNNPIALVDARNGNDTADGFVLVMGSSGALKIERKGSQQEWNDLEKSLTAGTWAHLTLVYEAASGDCTFYYNGEKVGTYSAVNSYTPPAGKHYFGSSRDPYWSAFKGQLAEPRIFSGALSAREVARLHNASSLAAEVGKMKEIGLVEGAQTVLYSAALAPAEAQVAFTLNETEKQRLITVAAELEACELTATLDGAEIVLGEALTDLAAGEHTLAWRLTPTEGADYAMASVSVQEDIIVEALTRVILPTPTPGEENNFAGEVAYGPNIGPAVGSGSKGTGVTAASPAAPGVDYTVTYEIHPLSEEPDNAITAVTLLYRADFGEIKRTAMTNTSGNLWQGTIPAADLPAEGHLLRYAAQIVDADGGTWRSPSFCNPDDGYEWFGTIVKGEADTDETLQTFHLFADSTALANMDKQYDAIAGSMPLGARVGVFDEQSNTYYDNVRIDLRGNTSAGFNKKSHGLRFNKCQPLTCTNPFDGEKIETRKTSFIAEYCDPTYIRQALSFWLFRQAGNLTPFDYPVRLQMNGEFYQLAFHSNRFTDELIEDYYGFGEDDGSVGYGYKNVGPFTGSNSATDAEKKTPDDGNEGDLSVLTALANTLPTATVTEENQDQYTQRVVEVFDLPAWVNYLAAARVTQECDDVWANISAYYDNLHTDTWMPLAYDLNLSFGQWYYNDNRTAGRIGLRTDDDTFKSHPLYGGFKIRAHSKDSTTVVGAANRALEALFQNAKFRRLYLRRLRTLMDAYLKAPGTEQDATPLWQQALRYKAAIAHLEETDHTKWNYSSQATGTAIWVWPSALSLEEGFTDLWENYIVPRRTHLYETHALGSTTLPEGYGADYAAGIPAAQSALDTLAPNFSFTNVSAADGLTGNALVIYNGNDETVDMSGWKLTGAVAWTLPAGTVIDAKDSLTVVADRKAYVDSLTAEQKAAAPVIVGNAEFSTTAFSLSLAAADGTTVCSASWPNKWENGAWQVTPSATATEAIITFSEGYTTATIPAGAAFTTLTIVGDGTLRFEGTLTLDALTLPESGTVTVSATVYGPLLKAATALNLANFALASEVTDALLVLSDGGTTLALVSKPEPPTQSGSESTGYDEDTLRQVADFVAAQGVYDNFQVVGKTGANHELTTTEIDNALACFTDLMAYDAENSQVRVDYDFGVDYIVLTRLSAETASFAPGDYIVICAKVARTSGDTANYAEGATVKLYLDGTEKTTEALPAEKVSALIGKTPASGEAWFALPIGEVITASSTVEITVKAVK